MLLPSRLVWVIVSLSCYYSAVSYHEIVPVYATEGINSWNGTEVLTQKLCRHVSAIYRTFQCRFPLTVTTTRVRCGYLGVAFNSIAFQLCNQPFMFSSDHLLFRGFQDNDVEHLYSVCNDFRVQRFITGEPVVPRPEKYK